MFLHSKSDDIVRKSYWDPLLLNMAYIIRASSNNENIGIFVPPLIFMGDYASIIYKDTFNDPDNITCKWNHGNSLYMNDLDRYYDFSPNTFIFPEGNCFICNKEIAEILYGDSYMYNLLNTEVSFDAVWFKSYYGERLLQNVGKNIQDIFKFFRSYHSSEKIYPNNIAWKSGHNGHADNMYEHSYERIIFKVVQKLGYNVKIMPWNKTSEHMAIIDQYNIKINILLKCNN